MLEMHEVELLAKVIKERELLNEIVEIQTGTILNLEEENTRLREALAFYAEQSNWVSRTGKIGIGLIETTDCEPYSGEYPGAGGKRAREALRGGE